MKNNSPGNRPPEDEIGDYINSKGLNVSDIEEEGRNQLPFSIKDIIHQLPGIHSISIENGLLQSLGDMIEGVFSLISEEITEMVKLSLINTNEWLPIEKCRHILEGMKDDPNKFLIEVHRCDPIVMYKFDGKYFMYSGYHRISAARHIELDEVPAEIIYWSIKKEWSFNMIMTYLKERLHHIPIENQSIALGIIQILEICLDWKDRRKSINSRFKKIIEITKSKKGHKRN